MGNTINSYARLARIHQPTGILLLLWPCWWSIMLAYISNIEKPLIELVNILFLFLIGSIVMRAAGCIINDMWDRNIDSMVQRTKNRPLASNELSMHQAFALLFLMLSIGLSVVIQLDRIAIILGFLFCIPVIIYPLMKRFFPYPQAFLGLTFNAGALIGWASIEGGLSISSYMLYAACIAWTLAYDTIYAHQDKQDDKKIGIKSTALTFGRNSKLYIFMFLIIFTILFAGAAFFISIKVNFMLLGLLVMLIVLLYNLYMLKLDEPEKCMRWFRQNGFLGILPFIGLLIDALIIK